MIILIHKDKRKTGVRAGIVTDENGRVLGRVERRRRDSGSKGPGAWYWTATVTGDPDSRTGGHSLGTRYPERRDAVKALRAYHQMFPWQLGEKFHPYPGWHANHHAPEFWRWSRQQARWGERVNIFLRRYDRGFRLMPGWEQFV